MADKKSHESRVTSHERELQKRIEELTAALQRERADSENIRRRHEQEVARLRSSVKAQVVKDLLPVIDNFERSLRHVPQKSHALRATSHEEKQLRDWIDGVRKILEQFEKTLEQMGVERIKTAGEAFDPHLHEAVSVEEGEGKHEVVSEELQAGYKIGDDVIRHAMVRVKVQ